MGSRLTKADLLAGSLGVLSLLAGVVLIIAAHGTVATVGAVLVGFSGISFTALVFLLVGESEDRDRRNGTL
jgi:hypothetical protein